MLKYLHVQNMYRDAVAQLVEISLSWVQSPLPLPDRHRLSRYQSNVTDTEVMVSPFCLCVASKNIVGCQSFLRPVRDIA